MLVVSRLLDVVMLLLSTTVSRLSCRVYKLGFLAPVGREHHFNMQTSAGAISIAIDTVHNDPLLNANGQIELSVVYRDSQCNSKEALGQSIDLWYNESVDAFLGPPCSVACMPVAEVASSFDIPMISWIATAPGLGDRERYSTLSRTLGPVSKMATFLLEILHQYNWQRIVVINSNYLLYKDLADAMVQVFDANNVTITYQASYKRYTTKLYARRTLKKVQTVGRIIYLISSARDIRIFMLMAYDLGMCTGDYVFYTLDIQPSSDLDQDRPWRGTDGRNKEARIAYESVFHVTLAVRTDSIRTEFQKEVARRSRLPPWNFPLEEGAQGNFYSPFLHDAVILYALALSHTLRDGKNGTDGITVVKNMHEKVFSGYSGNVILDDNGDREPDYWITDMDPITGVFVKVAEVLNEGLGIRVFNKDIHPPSWPNGKVGHDNAPADRPICGFVGELCVKDKGLTLVFTFTKVVACLLVTVAIAIGVVINRRKKFEKNLLIQSWRIYHENLELAHGKGTGSGSVHSCEVKENTSDNSCLRETPPLDGSMHSSGTNTSVAQQIFTQVMYYGGAMIAVKKIRKEHIQLSRNVLLEFSCVKEIINENLNVFVGACVDAPNIALFWRYCSKGSLLDLLNNDDIKLDSTFKVSFIMDVANGMDYLHKSRIVSHGNLKSSKCLVDGQWSLKITDYGLPTFIAGQNNCTLSENNIYMKKLWTAPELLRDGSSLIHGTQKGDVYSFSIVCYEIMTRSDPYSFDQVTPRDIVNRIRNGESKPFRPPLPQYHDLGEPILALVRSCWSEDPEERPPFIRIVKTLRTLTGGTINILDNTIKMMEQYSTNLEEIVNERTRELTNEKKRTDELLYRMLPRSAAEQLKACGTVKPEYYEQATVYFSDIVGFTYIASVSTPMQIVDFLNDLYMCFDDIIRRFDVYKVETIGDAYMLVSGVPLRNGTRHVTEVASCSIELLNAVAGFKIGHRPHQQLNLRIGIHSGSVVSAVVGIIMPRYCLFGDTVYMAEQLESTGTAQKIHISQSVYNSLVDTGSGYDITYAGEKVIMGRGRQKTYWLNRKQGFNLPESTGHSEKTDVKPPAEYVTVTD